MQPPQTSTAPLKLLVVEDDAPSLELMREVLVSLDAEVRSTTDSEQAAELVAQETFDGIFLDLQMPKLDGFELARRVRQSSCNRSTPIVIVTANEDQKTMEHAFAAGGSFFLRKPVERHKLTILLNSTRGVMLQNRRRLMRAPVSMEVTCQGSAGSIRAVGRNISEDGILLQGDGTLHPNDSLRLAFCLPGQTAAIRVVGVVTLTGENHIAQISFTSISPADRHRIRTFVAEHQASA